MALHNGNRVFGSPGLRVSRPNPTRMFVKILIVVAFAFLVVLLRPHPPAANNNISASVPVSDTDAEMLAAFAKAAASLDDFLALWQHPSSGTSDFSVKIGLKDIANAPGYALVHPGAREPGHEVEWFWTQSLRVDGSGFVAKIDNDPDTIKNVRAGQTIHFARQDIGDWMYMKNGKIVGNATMCPTMAHDSTANRLQMKIQLGVVCD